MQTDDYVLAVSLKYNILFKLAIHYTMQLCWKQLVAFNQVSFDDAYCQLPATGKPVERKLKYILFV